MSFDPLNQLKYWPKISEKPWDLAEKERLDNLYLQKWKNFSKEKYEIRKSFYWQFKNPYIENSENIQEIKNNIISETVKKSPYYPILESLKNTKNISEEKFNNTIKKLEKSEKWEEPKIIYKTIENISDSAIKKQIIKEIFSKNEITQENFEKSDFYKDSKQLKINIDNGVWWLEIMLAENYIKIPEKTREWNYENKNNNINTSLDIVLNKIIENNSKIFEKQNWELISDIKLEKNLNLKYNLLKKLYKKDLIEDAKFWWKKALKEISNKKKSLQEKAKQNTEKLNELNNKQLTEIEQKEKEKLELEKIKIIKEAKEINSFNWEVFEAWLVDKNSENPEKLTQNS